MSDGDNFILGTNNNSAVSETDLRVEGTGLQAYGLNVEVSASTGTALRGASPNGTGVEGNSPNSTGVLGIGGGAGVLGASDQGPGVLGLSKGVGVVGASGGGIGVYGTAQGGGSAGFFQGEVDIEGFVRIVGPDGAHVATNLDAGTVSAGTVSADTIFAATKNFRIDHPLNPKNKFLVHASVESSEMKTFYDGVVTLDRSGKATVRLPKWFEALNKDFRYQLTPVGAPGPNLHIAEGVTRNRFKIAGGAPSMKVCWQVTGIRQDKFAKDHPLSVEQDKRTVEQDKRREDIQHAQSRRRRLKEVQAKTQALMSAHSQRMEELQAIQKKK
jgi:hypothetical protein